MQWSRPKFVMQAVYDSCVCGIPDICEHIGTDGQRTGSGNSPAGSDAEQR